MANYTLVPVDGNEIKNHYGDDIFDGLVAYQPHLFDNVEWRADDPKVPFAGNVQLANGKFVYVVEPTKYGFVVKKQYREDPDEVDPVLREWGDYKSFDMFHAADIDLQDWLQRKIPFLGHTCRPTFRLRAFNARRSKQYKGKITVYQSHKDRDDGREVAMKPGRAFSLMFPELEHKVIIQLTDEFLQRFAPRTFTVHTASDAESFKLAYAGVQSETENIHTSCWRKHLAHSCMRYDFEHLPMHPAEAYASGDFDIVYVTDEDGLIGGRCVVYKKHDSGNPQPSPVYGVSEQAIDMIINHLETIGAVKFGSSCWIGARLSRRDYEDGFIAPYIDLSPQSLEESDCGKYLVVSNYGEIDASQYNGVLGSAYTHCESCGCGVSEDEYYYSEYNDNHYCPDCYHDDHYYCDWAGESVHHNETGTAFFWRNDRRCEETVAQWVLEDGTNFVMCSDHEYWHVDCAHYCEYEDEFISSADLDDYFWSSWDGELYPNDEFADVVDEHGDTESVSKDEAKEAGYVLDNDSGLWIKGESKDA
jgi:hypothetical protein